MAEVTEIVFDNFDNKCTLAFYQDGVAMVTSHITKTEIMDVSGTFTVDSVQNPTAFVWDSNNLILELGKAGLAVGLYPVRIIIYDELNPDGLVILHEFSETPLKLQIV